MAGHRQSVLARLARNRQRANIHSSARACADPTQEKVSLSRKPNRKRKRPWWSIFFPFQNEETPIEPTFNARGSDNNNSIPSVLVTLQTRGSRQPPRLGVSIWRWRSAGQGKYSASWVGSREQGPGSLALWALVRTVHERAAEGDPWQSQGFREHRRTQAQRGGLCRVGDLPGFVVKKGLVALVELGYRIKLNVVLGTSLVLHPPPFPPQCMPSLRTLVRFIFPGRRRSLGLAGARRE